MSLEEIIIGLLTACGYYVLWLNARWEDAQYERKRVQSSPIHSVGNASKINNLSEGSALPSGLPSSR